MLTRTRIAVAAGIALLVLAGALVVYLWPGSSDRHDALRVVNPVHNTAGVIMQAVPLHTPYVYVTYNVCSATGRPVKVSSVRTRGAVGDIRVVDWSVHSGPYSISDGRPGTATSLPGFADTSVTAKCNRAGTSFAALAISVEIGSPAAESRGFVINGNQIDPFDITECAAQTCHRLIGG